ncbi:MAG: primosomal protein N' [Candidatus Niyogibacteria bacterium]|nr:MAG: primosomal protein N' [Candidatus Niyogibacteria bacterium]
MWILEVTPISRSFLKGGPLTYFSIKKPEIGDVVEINLRGKNIPALVISGDKLESKKAAVKSGPFALKKINRIMVDKMVNCDFAKILKELSDYFIAPSSSILCFFLPKPLLNKNVLDKFGKNTVFLPEKPLSSNFKASIYQAERTERIKYYRGIIRESLSRGCSAAILLPTVSSAQDAFADLKTGLEERSFILHSDMSSKEISAGWKNISQSAQPIVLVGTALILPVLRQDTGVLVVEEESNEHYYHSLRRPFFDLRKAAELMAKKMGLHLVFGDIILRLDSGTHSHEYPGRLLSSAESKIIDVGKPSAEGFKIFSPEITDLLSRVIAKQESVILIGHRRGFSPTTLCQDCGQTVVCPNCSSPLVLHGQEQIRKRFFCHYCLKKEEVMERCPNCSSWKLASYGVGVEKLGEELKRLYPKVKLFRFDRDAVKSRKEALSIKQEFLDSPGSIMVATEIFLNYFRNPLPHIIIAAMDGLFSLPDYRMHERIMSFLIRLRSLAQKTFTIQTRLPNHPVFSYVVSGNIFGFQNDELEERRKLRYPPAVDLLKITYQDQNRQKLIANISALAKKIRTGETVKNQNFECVDFPAFVMRIRGRFRWHMLLKLERGSWPEKHPKIAEILKNLPPSWAIQIDPPSLL